PQAHQRLRLAREPLGELLARSVGPRDLDHHFRLEVAVPRLVDDAHPALAEPFEQVVPPAEAVARRGVGTVAHGRLAPRRWNGESVRTYGSNTIVIATATRGNEI